MKGPATHVQDAERHLSNLDDWRHNGSASRVNDPQAEAAMALTSAVLAVAAELRELRP